MCGSPEIVTLDTGAGGSCIPLKVLQRLDPKYTDKLIIREFETWRSWSGKIYPLGVYTTSVKFLHEEGDVIIKS